MQRRNRSTLATAIIFIILQSLTMIGLIMKSRYDNVLEVITITLIFLIYFFLKTKYNLYMKNYINFIVILTIIGHNLVGEYFDLYMTSFIYDKLLHLFGTYAFTLFFYSLIVQLFPVPDYSKSRELIFIVLLGITIGSAFEIIEFLVDIIFKPKIPTQDSLIDTDLDIIFDIVGALLAALYAHIKSFKLFRPHELKSG